MAYVSLHTHTNYSLLDGEAKIPALVKRAKELGMSALAITDHGNMFGAVKFYNECKKQDIKPIIGCEVYTSERSMLDKDSSKDRKIGHLILLCKDKTGYENLIKIVSNAYVDGFYYKPRTDKEQLKKYHEGLICLSGCLAGKTQRLLAEKDYKGAREEAEELKSIFGKDFYLELQNHNLPEDRIVVPGLVRLSHEIDVPLVVTNDSHYILKEDAEAHDVLLCIQTQSLLSDPNRMRFTNDEFYLKSEEEMKRMFVGNEDAVDRTSEIADKCNFEFEFGHYHVPKFEIPAQYKSEYEYFRALCEKGFKERYGEGTKEQRDRFEYEIKTIKDMGYIGYFLIVWDFINHAKEAGIPVGKGRGCVNKGTKIYTENGLVPIEDIKPGMMVYTHDGTLQKVTNTFKYPVNETLYRIGCYFGDKEGNAFTSDHKIYAVKANRIKDKRLLASGYRYLPTDSEPEWIKASDLEVGDLVVAPQFQIKTDAKNVIDLAEFAGPKAIIEDDKIIEYKSCNNVSNVSIREINRRTGVDREQIKRYRDSIDIKLDNKEKIEAYIHEHGFTTDEWREFLKSIPEMCKNTIKRYVQVDEAFMYVLGAMTGNGWVRRKGNDIGFCCNTENVNSKMLTDFETVFGIAFNKVNKSKTTKLIQYTVSSYTLKNFMLSLWDGYNYNAQTKSLPEWCQHETDKNKFALLEGLWSTDGSHKGKSKYTSVSWKLINDIKIILSSLNIPNSLTFRAAHYNPYAKVERSSDSWQITVPHYFFTESSSYEKKADYVLKRIRQIEEVTDEKYVYDITVENNHSYVTASFAAHNSAAGSLVSYSLGITDIDPLKYALVFERFLNPERVSMPDVDVDFCIRRRPEIIEYVAEKYGRDCVSQIVTFTTMKAKRVIRDVAKVMGMPYSDADKLAKMIPEGNKVTLQDTLDTDPDFKEVYEKDAEARRIIDMSLKLEGNPRDASVHASGIVIASEPVSKYVPMCMTNKGAATMFDMTEIETLGMLKFDFLGLRNLTVIDDTIKMVKRNYGIDIDISSIDFDDKKVFENLSNGNTVGIFQLEAQGITEFFKQLKPEKFEDIVAGVSLYRPGPMDSIPEYLENKKHPDKIQYLDEKLRPILDVTYGVTVYQEQVMQIVRDLAGYSFGRADLVRRAMAKKKMEVMLKEKEYFINGKLDDDGNVEIPGCVRNGVSKEAAEKIYDGMVSFAQYAFNKSHAAAYSVITYETAWLKTYYPSEFMAALMTNTDNLEHVEVFIKDARKQHKTKGEGNIRVLPPHVLYSTANFEAMTNGNILFGLASIKGVGTDVANDIASMDRKGYRKQKDINASEFFEKLPDSAKNKRVMEGLCKSGAMNDIFGNIHTSLMNYQGAMDSVKKSSEVEGQISLFESNEELKQLSQYNVEQYPEYEADVLLAFEKEFLGCYISGHPLENCEAVRSAMETYTISEVKSGRYENRQTITFGLVSSVKTVLTKKGDKMAFMTMCSEDNEELEVVVFPKAYAISENNLAINNIVVVSGDIKEEKILAGRVMSLDEIVPARETQKGGQ